MTITCRTVGPLTVVIVALAGPAGAQPLPLDLGTLGGCCSIAWGINASGQVVGVSATPAGEDHSHAFLWTAEGGMVDLGTLGGRWSTAYAVNPNGLVVGWSAISETESHGFAWTTDGMVDLGTLGGHFSIVTAVNGTGEVIVGYSTLADETITHAFAWTWKDGMMDLGTLGGTNVAAVGVDWDGNVVGSSTLADGRYHAFWWSRGTGMVDLGTLGGRRDSTAASMNISGRVAGISRLNSLFGPEGRPFSWTPEDGMVDLGVRPADRYEGGAIGDGGHIVGWAEQYSPDVQHWAFSWSAVTGERVLGPSADVFYYPTRVNAYGLAVGSADTRAGTLPFVWHIEEEWSDLLPRLPEYPIGFASGITDDGDVVGTLYTADGSGHRAVLWPHVSPPTSTSSRGR